MSESDAPTSDGSDDAFVGDRDTSFLLAQFAAPVPDYRNQFPDLDVMSRFGQLSRPGTERSQPLLVPDLLCRAAVAVLPIDGAAISVRLGLDVSMPIGSSDAQAATAEQLQFTLGQGPCLAALASGDPIILADLKTNAVQRVWPTYVAEMARLTFYEAAFAFPLSTLGFAMGTLNMYRHRSGPLSTQNIIDIDWITQTVTADLDVADLFDTRPGPPSLAYQWRDAQAARRRHQVWVAQGMTMRANSVNARHGLALLRAAAYASGRLVDDLADDIVHDRLPPPRLTVSSSGDG